MKKLALFVGFFMSLSVFHSEYTIANDWNTDRFISFNSTLQKTYVLTYKITGMNSEEDAKIITETLMKSGFVTSAVTSFESGTCIVETLLPENAGKIKETISSSTRKIGRKIVAELLDTVEKS